MIPFGMYFVPHETKTQRDHRCGPDRGFEDLRELRGQGSPGYPECPTHGDIVAGFRAHSVAEVAQRFGISPAAMAERIGVSRATFHRRQKEDSLLTAHESDALARHSSLLTQAIAVFDGDEDAARQWLNCPQVGLGGAIPLECAQTSFGFREVEKLLTRIDRGTYA
jgi:putative toxin-antitoxin system antitoxin component (TIGR02293 family)